MNGHGMMIYSDSKGEKDSSYQGQFHLNSREGSGVLTKKNGDVFTGDFKNNHPNGEVVIECANGDRYEGEVSRGIITGNGLLQCTGNKSYKGTFKEGKLNGDGTFYVEGGTYSLSGGYTDGVASKNPLKYNVEVTSPVEEEEDTKGKKDPKKGGAETEREGGNEIKV